MKTLYFLIFIFSFSFYSCKKDEKSDSLSKTPPKTPATISYDLNDDHIDDIKIEYGFFSWDGLNSSGDGISGLIKPINGSAVLRNMDDYPLFNTINDTIKTNVTEPYIWEKYMERSIVSISTSPETENLWPNTWKIQSKQASDFYYLGITIHKSQNLTGWIKIKINQSSGAIQIVDKKFTTEEFIVIRK